MLDKARRDPEELIAPVSGVIADGSAVAGQIAQPNAVIFHIIDPSKLWVEALSFSVVAEAQSAFARTAAGKTYTITHRGSGFADRSQSIPVHFAIEGDLSSLRAGQFVSVLVMTDEEQSGIAVPRSALVRAANGQDVVYEHVSAELFAPRQVRTSPLDGERVLITAGLTPGKRIVTQGAELLEHVR
jgi:multidrug efflux pump subunit AcrA (membrane-fusion protein)